MSTPKLPFYEKDAKRWKDLIALAMGEISMAIKTKPNMDHLDPVVWQLDAIMDDIERTISGRRVIVKKK